MANIDKIDEYNKGTLWPYDYSETYLATKHIQKHPLILIDDLINQLQAAVTNAGLFFDDDDLLKEIATGLVKGNVILQGPPGTGKTTLAAIICDVFNVNYEVITAVSDWTTYDTIGGLQPSVDEEGNEIITGKNGRIVESIIDCCNSVLQKEHHSGKEQATWLVVDELNRSEIDKVFGDLFTVFGSDDPDKRKLTLWFENDKNKQQLYVPLRYRIIGLMNNVDKNFVFDLSHGLARRFSIISVLPPTIESVEKEIEKCKENLKKKIPNKISKSGATVIDENYIDKLIVDTAFIGVEKTMISLLKHIRYEEDDTYLGLQYGTAQIMDLYENIFIHMILENYMNLSASDKEVSIKHIVDASINDRIVPQIDGFDYLKRKKFCKYVDETSEFDWFTKSKRTLKSLD